jgi:AraC-like DNA-binding protein
LTSKLLGCLSALAQLRATAIRGTLTGSITLPAASHGDDQTGPTPASSDVSDTGLQIPLGDAPTPARGGQPCPPGIVPVKLSIAETARLTGLARQHTAGLITRTHLAFALRWSLRRRLHQAIARWHHYSARLLAAGTG